MNEIWKTAVGYPAYEVSNIGRIKSYYTTSGKLNDAIIADGPQRILKQTPSSTEYFQVSLVRDGTQRRFNVHRIVAAAFLGPCPPGHEVCHENGDRQDNRVENLRYDTRRANHHDKYRHKTVSNTHLSESDVVTIRQMAKDGVPTHKIMSKFSIGYLSFSYICRGKTFKPYGGPILTSDDLLKRKAKDTSRRMRGEGNSNAKLTAYQVRQIRSLRSQGKKCRELADIFGVTTTAISHIALRKSWAHID